MSRIQNKALKLHSSSIRPRAVKVQSPPYPITGNEDVINAVWETPSIDLEKLMSKYTAVENVSPACSGIADIGFRSIVITLDTGTESFSPKAMGQASIDFSSVIKTVEVPLETGGLDFEGTASITLDRVILLYDNAETEATALDFTGSAQVTLS